MFKIYRRKGNRAALPVIVASALLTVACASSGGSGGNDQDGPATLRVVIQQVNFASIPLALGEDLNFFKDEDLTLKTTVAESTSTSTAGLVGGSFDLQVGGAELLVAREQGVPVIGVAGMCNAPVWSVVAKKGTKDLKDIKGAVVGTSGPDSVSTVAMVAALKQAGVSPDDYKQITAGGTASRVAALQNGQIDATVVTSPAEFQLVDKGFANLGSLYDTLPAFASGFVATTEQYATSNDEVMVRFSKAWLKTLEYMYDPANKDDLVERVATILETPEVAVAQAYDYWIGGDRVMFPKDGKIDRDALEGAAEGFVENGTLKQAPDLSEFVVDTYIDKAASGQ